MFDQFTDQSRQIMGLARQEAMHLNHEYIGTEHLLLGILLLHERSPLEIIAQLRIQPAILREAVKQLLTFGPNMETLGQLPFTPRAKKVLEIAYDEATAGRYHESPCQVEPGHLLLALLQEVEGIASIALRNHGVNESAIRAALPENAYSQDRNPHNPFAATEFLLNGIISGFADGARNRDELRKLATSAQQEIDKFRKSTSS